MVVKKNTDFWIGREVEGRFKGIKTLFVRGDQLVEDISSKLENNFVVHIYFGAGNQSKVTKFNVIEKFVKIGFLISLEIDFNDYRRIPQTLIKNKNLHLILTFKSDDIFYIKPTDSFKIEDKKNVFMMSKSCMYKSNKLNDYEGDEFV